MNDKAIAAVIGGLAMLAPAPASAQRYVALREAVSLAVGHDVRLLDAEAKEKRAAAEADVARAIFRPNLFTGTGAVYTYGFPQTPGGGPPSVFNLGFTQTIFDGPAKGLQRAAIQRIDVQRLETARVRDTAMLDAAAD